MESGKDLLGDFENQPDVQLMNLKWQLAGIFASILLILYSFAIKYLEFDLISRIGVNDLPGFMRTSQIIQQLLIVVAFWVAFTFLLSLIPVGMYTYSQKLKPVSIILLVIISLVTAVIFTLGYYEVKEIVRFSRYY